MKIKNTNPEGTGDYCQGVRAFAPADFFLPGHRLAQYNEELKMRPNSLIRTKYSTNGNFTIEGYADAKIKLIATNLCTSTKPRMGYGVSISFMQHDGPGIVALQVQHAVGCGKNQYQTETDMFLEFSDRKIEEERYWIPIDGVDCSFEQIGSFNKVLRVLSETGKIYTANPEPAPGEYYVPYEKLLCQYVVGEVEESVLQEAATLQAEEISAREMLALFKVQITSLQRQLETQDENAKNFAAKFQQARKTVYDMRRQLLPALPLIKRFQNKLYGRVKSAINLADKEIPRQQHHAVLYKEDKVVS